MKLKFNFWPVLPLILIGASFEIATRSAWIPAYLAPAPSQIFYAFAQESAELWISFSHTGLAALTGFAISTLLGLGFGILFSSHRIIQRALYPYATFFQTVPIVAIAPLLVIWFGYGTPTVIASTVIVSIFPIIASTLSGIRSTDPALLDLFKIYRASRTQTLVRLQIPFALPQIFVGLRIASGLAVIGAIVGEFIAGGGLGGFIDVARTRQKLDQLFAAILLATFLGFLFLSVIDLIAKIALRHWHASERNT